MGVAWPELGSREALRRLLPPLGRETMVLWTPVGAVGLERAASPQHAAAGSPGHRHGRVASGGFLGPDCRAILKVEDQSLSGLDGTIVPGEDGVGCSPSSLWPDSSPPTPAPAFLCPVLSSAQPRGQGPSERPLHGPRPLG